MASCASEGKASAINYTLRCVVQNSLEYLEPCHYCRVWTGSFQRRSIVCKCSAACSCRYAAPEVVQAAMSGAATMMVSTESDMWSLGVIMYELYTGRRLFDDSMPEEDVVADLCCTETTTWTGVCDMQPGELNLKGLQNIDVNAARFIQKLLSKDPALRWSAKKALQSQFFRIMDDTTKLAAAPKALSAAMKNMSLQLERVLDMQMTTLSDMQMGDLVIEIDIQETKPRAQPCLLTDHDKAGSTFNLVNGCSYSMVLNMFREGGNMTNPVKRVSRLIVKTEDGDALPLAPVPTNAWEKKALPNCVSVSAPFDPADCRLLTTATKWPDVRTVSLEIYLELTDVEGREVPLMPTINFQVHASETPALKALRAKNWAENRYNNLAPSTRRLIKGMVVVARLAKKAAIGI
eukprot:1194527-Prorocentrum_minimum.AAC.3